MFNASFLLMKHEEQLHILTIFLLEKFKKLALIYKYKLLTALQRITSNNALTDYVSSLILLNVDILCSINSYLSRGKLVLYSVIKIP